MAIFHQEQEQSSSSLLDELYCEEEKWEDDNDNAVNNNKDESFLLPLMLLEQDMFWEDEELECLFKKEQKSCFNEVSMINARKLSIEWILKVNSRYGFCALTSILSVNYFDRCISSVPFIQQPRQPWTLQLAAVACLSLASKVEETHVPYLLDLQVEGARPIFEPRDVQKMELLVLSTLEWKMHPVTPLSFLDHIIRRLGLKNQLHWEFLKRCESVLLSLLPDWRFVSYLPSVLATATMMHVIDQIDDCNSFEYQTQLLNVLNITKEMVIDCYELIKEKSSDDTKNYISNSKRKFEQMMTMNDSSNSIPSSPSGVIDAYAFNSDSSNDSWQATSTNTSTTVSLPAQSSVTSSPVTTSAKKGRVCEQPMPLQLPSLSRVFVDLVASPR